VICYEILFGGFHPFEGYPDMYKHPIMTNFDTSEMENFNTFKYDQVVKDTITMLLNFNPKDRPFIKDILNNFIPQS